MKSTSPACRLVSSEARSPARSMAGPEVMRIETPISAATIIPSVVLPRPGGPWKSRWSSGSLRPCAAAIAMRRLSFTVSWPK